LPVKIKKFWVVYRQHQVIAFDASSRYLGEIKYGDFV